MTCMTIYIGFGPFFQVIFFWNNFEVVCSFVAFYLLMLTSSNLHTFRNSMFTHVNREMMFNDMLCLKPMNTCFQDPIVPASMYPRIPQNIINNPLLKKKCYLKNLQKKPWRQKSCGQNDLAFPNRTVGFRLRAWPTEALAHAARRRQGRGLGAGGGHLWFVSQKKTCPSGIKQTDLGTVESSKWRNIRFEHEIKQTQDEIRMISLSRLTKILTWYQLWYESLQMNTLLIEIRGQCFHGSWQTTVCGICCPKIQKIEPGSLVIRQVKKKLTLVYCGKTCSWSLDGRETGVALITEWLIDQPK